MAGKVEVIRVYKGSETFGGYLPRDRKTKMNEGFHWSNGMYFRRVYDGSVEIRQMIDASSDEVRWKVVVPPSEWASIVAAVSYQGETGPTYRQALRFHGVEGRPVPPHGSGPDNQ